MFQGYPWLYLEARESESEKVTLGKRVRDRRNKALKIVGLGI
jgi:hypothetical protein